MNQKSSFIQILKSVPRVLTSDTNANTENFARREVSLQSIAQSGGGVRIAATTRIMDAKLDQELRSGLARTAYAESKSDQITQIVDVFGNPDSDASLNSRLVSLEVAFQTAEADPSSQANLQSIVNTSKSLTGYLASAQDKIQSTRIDADREIENAVNTLTRSLQKVEELNHNISSQHNRGQSTNGLIDQRDMIINEISKIVPVRTLARDQQNISLVTQNGFFLLDTTASSIEFESTRTIVPHMTAENGLLSGVEIDGEIVAADSTTAPLGGGLLQSLFETRDETAVSAQAQLDGIAFELAQRLQDPSVEVQLGMNPGLMTDRQQRVELVNVIGLAGRLQVNAQIDPYVGGDSTNLRNGLMATSSFAGDAAQLTRYLGAVSGTQLTQAPALSGATGSLGDLAGIIVSNFAQIEQSMVQDVAYSQTSLTHLQAEKANMGVNTDQELQNLMLIEKAYAANARVIQAVDEMMNTLLRIGS